MVSNIAVVIVAYNRPVALKRLLASIESATYIGYNNITLIISIDQSESEECFCIANAFQWDHGFKQIVKFEINIGLREHILKCGELTQEYESVIILEDDCFVSRNFYNYSCQALSFYQNHSNIAGLSLYAYQTNENALLPFSPLADGYDAYFMQIPSSWGQVWTASQWTSFKTWMAQNPVITDMDLLPENVKSWPASSWKKYFYKYMVKYDKYFVYPAVSLVSNFGDKGTHYSYPVPYLQVPIETRMARKDYSFISFNESYNKYDAYFELLPANMEQLGVAMEANTGIDLYGTKQPGLFAYDYLFSIRDCTAPLQSYAAVMFPLAQNILNGIRGNTIHYAKAASFLEERQQGVLDITRNFQLQGYTLGLEEGSNKATRELMQSLSYRIGSLIIQPFYWLSRKFKKSNK